MDGRQDHLIERAASLLRETRNPIPPMPRADAVRVASSRSPSSATERLAGADASVLDRAAPSPPPPPPPPTGLAAHVLAMEVMERAGLVDGAGKRTRVAEEFNISAGNLLRAMRAAQSAAGNAVALGAGLPNLLMVTSAKPDEGKSFSALNLAASMARNGLARVVLADIDPKLGSLTTQLELDGFPGLLELAADPSLRLDALLVRTVIRDLAVLPLGAHDIARGDRGIASQLLTAIDRVARRLGDHLIVLDAPPCLATSEPATLAPLVGVVAMVVEAERTQRDDLDHALEMLKPCPNVLLLLNKMRGTTGPAFGDYDYYGA